MEARKKRIEQELIRTHISYEAEMTHKEQESCSEK